MSPAPGSSLGHRTSSRPDRSSNRDGSVLAWVLDGPAPDWATNVVRIAMGWGHSLALKADGTVLAWGDDSHGQSTVPDSATNAVAVSAGFYHSLALRADGTVVAWGRDAFGMVGEAAGLRDVAQVDAGEGYYRVRLLP